MIESTSEKVLLLDVRRYLKARITQLKAYPKFNPYAKNLLRGFQNVLRVSYGQQPFKDWGDK
jgi:hypothetical protein